MDKRLQTLQQNLDSIVQKTDEQGIEFWFARDLQQPLGYARWENFQTAIKRAMESCEASGHAASDHFRGVTKMVELGSGSKRPVEDSLPTLTQAATGECSQNNHYWCLTVV